MFERNDQKVLYALRFVKPPIFKGLVQDVFFKRSVYVLVSRGLSMFRRGLTGPEMKFLDDFW